MSNIKYVAMGCKPDPFKFEIEKVEFMNDCTIVQANYGGTTFGGSKLMVLRGVHKNIEVLDPHFINNDHPVFARFNPTKEGWILARLTTNDIKELK